MNRVRGVYLIILIGALVWCGLIIAAPLLLHAGSGALVWHDAISEGFHRVCHQLDSRSLHLYGQPLPVCMRCSAVYFAFLAGVGLYPLFHSLREPRSPSRLVLILAVAPMLLDVALGIAGVADVTAYSRLLTGALFGLLIPFVILPVALGAVHERSIQPTIAVHQQKGSADA